MAQASLILGLGTGRCGTHTLTDVLARQPESSFTHEEFPLLSWTRLPGRPGVAERIRRIRGRGPARFIGDVALFYLPYAEEIIALEPGVRMICVERPREQVVQSFGRFLDARFGLPTDHWSRVPADGWYDDPVWTPIFPKYNATDRDTALRMYWDDYHARSEALSAQFPEQFRIFGIDALNSRDGLRDLLTFAGIPLADQNLETGVKTSKHEDLTPHYRRGIMARAEAADPRHCVVLVPATASISPGCEAGLRQLEQRGYEVRRGEDGDSFDMRCNRLASAALTDGFLETMWIGPDIVFNPDDVERLRAHRRPMCCGLYPRTDRQVLDCHFFESASSVTLGAGGGLTEILHAGMRFLLVRRPVYMDLIRSLGLPFCDQKSDFAQFPFFQPLVGSIDDGYRWLESEFAFSEFARRSGYRVYADTSIRLFRQGSFAYGWEEAGRRAERYEAYHLHLA